MYQSTFRDNPKSVNLATGLFSSAQALKSSYLGEGVGREGDTSEDEVGETDRRTLDEDRSRWMIGGLANQRGQKEDEKDPLLSFVKISTATRDISENPQNNW